MGATKYKIAYFQQDGLVTGSAISLRHFLSAINRDVFEPIVILAKEGPARNLYESLNIQVLVHNYTTFWTFPGPRCFSRGMLSQLRALISNVKLRKFVLEEINPNLIHINDKAALNVGITLKGFGVPIVQHSRSSYYITSCKLGRYLSAKVIKNFANHIICISEDEEDGFEDFSNKSTIYNTVDFNLIGKAKERRRDSRQSLGINEQDILIGFASHVSEKKGAWDFLELCRQLKQNANFKFILAGQLDEQGLTYLGKGKVMPISPKAYVDSFIKENRLENQLIITGFRNDILDLIAAMDVLVVPNKNGVLGRQPIEAQALGVTVIAQTGHSKKSKIIKHDVTGYLVQNIEQCLELLKKWTKSNEARNMAQSAQTYAAQKFSPIINMKGIETIYLNLIKS
jgi:glycosyltransferase involved in cell wall biosynthesis